MGVELVVAAASAVAGFASAAGAVSAWLNARRRSRRVKITLDGDTIELNALSPEDAEKIIEAYIARSAEKRETGE